MVYSKNWLLKLLGISGFCTFLVVGTQLSPVLAEATTATKMSQMTIFQAFILGIVQGLAEFLPISSTAHLKVVPVALGWGDPGLAVTAVLPLGCVAAVVWYFRQDLRQITFGFFKAIKTGNYNSQDFRLGLGIAIGTLPAIFFGLLVKVLIPNYDQSPLRSLFAIAIASIVMSLLLGIAELLGRRQRNFAQLGLTDSIIMGFAQSLAIIPGVSRSGATLTAGLFMGLERETAARFSFLLGIPAVTLAGLVELKDAFKVELGSTVVLPLIVGLISTTIFSYLAIAWLLRYLQTQNTWVFVCYRLVFGVAILGAIAAGFLKNS